MAKGWISIHRKIWGNWIWAVDEPFDKRSAWIDLILLANHEDKKILFNGTLTFVKKGSKVTSLGKLATRWSWSKGKVKRFLEMLQEDNMITYEQDSKKTVYTICNYNIYQNEDLEKRNAHGTQTEHRRNTDGTQTEPNNNENNDNNDNNMIYITRTHARVDINIYIINNIISKRNRIKEIQPIDQSVVEYNKKSISDILEKYGEENLYKAIDNINQSDWLKGLTDKSNWTISFKWFLNYENFNKVLCGEYTTKHNKRQDKKPKFSQSTLDYMPTDDHWEKILEELDE